MAKRTVPAANFMATVAANVENKQMSDADFRKFIRDSLPVVAYDGAESKPSHPDESFYNGGPYGVGSQDR